MSPSIWLIAEDLTDAEIVDRRGLSIRVRLLTPEGNARGIFVLAAQLEKLIRRAIQGKKTGDCIAVLHDADIYTQPDRTAYERIRATCQRYQDTVALIVVYDEIESWLLADEGLCRWLGVRPQNCDSQAKPSDRLRTLLQRKRMKWQGRDRQKVLEQIDGTGDRLSPSMQTALSHLEDAPCTRPETI
jgi:hypothetical protein